MRLTLFSAVICGLTMAVALANTAMAEVSAPAAAAAVVDEEERQAVNALEVSRAETHHIQEVRAAGFAYGTEMGKRYMARVINLRLEAEAEALSRIYHFAGVVQHGPDGLLMLPPAVLKTKTKTSGRSDTQFKIVESARLIAAVPSWRDYLIQAEPAPSTVAPNIPRPRNDIEEKLWLVEITSGWEQGVRQALDQLKADQSRLDRHYAGMHRYLQLWVVTAGDDNLSVSPPLPPAQAPVSTTEQPASENPE